MRHPVLLLVAGSLLSLSACEFDIGSPGPTPTPTPTPTATPTPGQTIVVDVDLGAEGAQWTAGFADYADAQAALIDFQSGVRVLPAPLNSRSGFLLGGTNRSDDLTMFLYRGLTGLDPAATYRVETEVVIASNVPPGCFGVGGSPGESVYIKAGAAPRQPAVAKDAQGDFKVNVDQGQQAQGGSEAVVIGDFAAPGAGACDNGTYTLKTLPVPAAPPQVRPDAQGRLWLYLSTDSAFEARTEAYFVTARFRLVPL